MRYAASKKVSWLMIFILLFTWSDLPQYPSLFAQEQVNPTAEDREKAVKRLEKLFDALEEAAKEIPRDTFDPQAIVNKVGKDPKALFEWVRDNTYLVPYRGSLRGPIGVLMDRLGNSLDRALLLHELLRLAGHNARLAQADLSDTQAQKVQRDARPIPSGGALPPEPTSPSALNEALEKYVKKYQLDRDELKKFVDKLSLDQQRMAEEITQRVEDQTKAILALVGESKETDDAQVKARKIAAAKEHWWIQWEQESEWIDLDPTLPDTLPGKALRQAEKTLAPDDLNEDLLHRVTIRVVIEQWKDGGLEEHEVLKHTLQPAKLIGERIVLQHIPMNWPKDLNLFEEKDPLETLKKTALEEREWLPVLTVGSEQIKQFSFTSTGDVNEKPGTPPTSQPLGGMGVGGLFGGFGGALSGDEGTEKPKTETKNKASQLTAEWVEYELRSPGQQARTIRRQVLDLVGPAVRSEGKVPFSEITEPQRLERSLAMVRDTDILIQVCNVAPGYVTYLMAKSLLTNREVLSNLFRSAEPARGQELLRRLGKMLPLPAPEYFLAADRHSWNIRGDAVFLDQSNVLSYVRGLGYKPTGKISRYQGFDIVANEVAARSAQNDVSFFDRLYQGVLDTNVEAMSAGEVGGVIQNTAVQFATSRAKGIEWVAVQHPGNREWQQLALPKDVRARIEEDLAEGYVAIVPSRPAQASGPVGVGWWRVDPRNGNTLGLGPHGDGADMAEYGAITAEVAAPTILCLIHGQHAVKSKIGKGISAALCMLGVGLPALGLALGVHSDAIDAGAKLVFILYGVFMDLLATLGMEEFPF